MKKIACAMIVAGLAICAFGLRPAMVQVDGDFSVDEFKLKSFVFADRGYRIAMVPQELAERPLLRTRIDGFVCTVTEPGELICLTPAADGPSPCSQDAALSGYGFELMAKPCEFQLFGTEACDRVRAWRKVVKAGEKFTFRKFACLLAQEARPIPKEPINIDLGRQLFLDDNLVEIRTMKRKWIEPTIDPRSPVLKPETELERSNNTKDPNWNALAAPFSGGVWYDGQDKLYKCWYLAGWANGIAYATSMDGITWIRPDLDGKGNNLTYRTRGMCDSNAILLDPDCIDGYRWKGFAFDLGRAPGPLDNPTTERRMMGASVAVSKDGIHWTEPEQASQTGDRTTAFYNPFIRKWVYSVRRSRTENGLQMGRWRNYAEGDDFIRDAKNMKCRGWRLKGSAGGRQVNGQELYNFDAVAYESVMIGLALIYNSPQNTYWDKRGLPKIADLKFGFNTMPAEYDNWQFPWINEHDGFFLSGTRKYGDWNMGYLQSNSAICIVQGDELWFYFTAFAGQPDKPKEFSDVNHKSGTYANGTMGIAKLRRDGFCSLSDGTITTRRLVFTRGDRLWINADVRLGELKVASSGGLSRTFKGVDSTRLEVGKIMPGREFTLTFTAMGGAKLYAFWTSDAKGRSGGYLAGGSPESETLRDM